jgi:hypothetical protein
MGNPLLVGVILPRNRPGGKHKSVGVLSPAGRPQEAQHLNAGIQSAFIPRRADGESPAMRNRSASEAHDVGHPRLLLSSA